MFYAAIILILLGVLVFVYSVSVEKRTVSPAPSPVNPSSPVREKHSVPELKPVETASEPVSINSLSLQDDYQEPVLTPVKPPVENNFNTEEKNEPAEMSVEKPAAAEAEPPAPDAPQKVAFYEDSSGVVEYRGLSSEIDSTLEKYKHIRRIGEGLISAEKNGISFYIEKKLYRYDYHRISEFNTGDDFIAFKVGGQPQVKLFIFREGDGRIEQIAAGYAIFHRDNR